jgi:hypothetical protein
MWVEVTVVHLVQVLVEHGILEGHAAVGASAAWRRAGDFYAGKKKDEIR